MVIEFPELQGVMGRYYARHDAEPDVVADAIEAHYRPRFSGDALPEGLVACAVALADKLDTLAGLFGIDEQPSGEKDPFGLRRAALGVIRILVERGLPVGFDELLAEAHAAYRGASVRDARAEVTEFVYARFTSYLKELGFTTLQVDAVLALKPSRFDHVPRQLEAVRAFQSMPEAESLAAANKRVVNILRQAQSRGETFAFPVPGEFREPAERSLFEALQDTSRRADGLYEKGDYTGYLESFAVLKAPVDAFFDTVMVMAEEAALRRNRLGLLRELRSAMNRVADIARLAL
jgi:glycyl-tRNA synthetase beta chain